jgi:hypothetical protein
MVRDIPGEFIAYATRSSERVFKLNAGNVHTIFSCRVFEWMVVISFLNQTI